MEIPHWNPFEVEIPYCGFPNFRRDLVHPDTYHGLKFEFCAFSSLKVDRLEEKPEKKGKIVSKSIGVNEHNHKKCEWWRVQTL